MTVTYPEVFWLFVIVAVVIPMLVWKYRRGRRDLERLGSEVWSRELANVFLVKSFFRGLCTVLFFSFVILGLAGFHWGRRPIEEDRSGIEIVFAIDVSPSMLAEDVGPNRLERGKDIVRSVVQDFPESRFAVVAFGGRAVPVLPMTEDGYAVQSLLSVLSPETLTSPGTDIEGAIESALDTFPEGSARHQALVLISDGEYHTGNPSAAARSASARGIPVFSITTGSEQGSSIPLTGGGVVETHDGEMVRTRANPSAMRQVAEATDGLHLSAGEGEVFARLREGLAGYTERRDRDGFRLASVPRYRLFLALALLFLVLENALRIVRWRRIL